MSVDAHMVSEAEYSRLFKGLFLLAEVRESPIHWIIVRSIIEPARNGLICVNLKTDTSLLQFLNYLWGYLVDAMNSWVIPAMNISAYINLIGLVYVTFVKFELVFDERVGWDVSWEVLGVNNVNFEVKVFLTYQLVWLTNI